MKIQYKYAIGEKVIVNGFPAVIREYYHGMYNVNLERGSVCVAESNINHPFYAKEIAQLNAGKK